LKNKVTIQTQIDCLPIHEYAFMGSSDVIFSDEVRGFCEKNGCGMHGTSWACPPAVGTVEECKAQCLTYKHAFMFTTVTKMKNNRDIKGWQEARKEHEKVSDSVADIFRSYDKNALILSTEGCLICKKCAYPDEPCRFPERMYPATESYGILVMQQAKECNVKYMNGTNTVTYFSMIFFNEKE